MRSGIVFLLLFFRMFGYSQDTTTNTLSEIQLDSVTKIRIDSIKKAGVQKGKLENLSGDSITTSKSKKVKKVDTSYYSPKKAALLALACPGLGQIYNKKYWKLPIVYGALGVSGAVFSYNLKNYRALRFAYKGKIEATPKFDPITMTTIPGDSTNYKKIRRDLVPLDINALRSYRDEFRRNIDYSALAFIVLWGLNVVDATVDAHLKAFDVSPDLSFKFQFGHSEMAGTNGLSLVLAFK